VTDYEDIVKAIGDGRMKRIVDEYDRYQREHKG
jgi:hypothetical protein